MKPPTLKLCDFCESDDGREVRGSPDFFSMIPGQTMEMVWACFSCARIYHTVLIDFGYNLDLTKSPKQLSFQVRVARKESKRIAIERIRNEN